MKKNKISKVAAAVQSENQITDPQLQQQVPTGAPRSKTITAIIALVCANCIFGLSFIFSKAALSLAGVTPAVLLMWRFVAALLVMTVLLPFLKHKISLRGKPWGYLILLGVFEPVLYFLCESYGLLYSTATFSAVMIALIPIVTLMFGVIILREPTTLWQVFFCLLSIAGVIAISLTARAEGSVQLPGIFLLLGAVLTAVGFNLVSRHSSRYFTAFERTYFCFIIGAVFFTVMALGQNYHDLQALVGPLQLPMFWIAVLYLGMVSSVIAYLALNYANTWLPVARSSSFANIVTIVSVFAGIIFLQEPCNAVILISAAMIVIGVWGVQKTAPKSLE